MLLVVVDACLILQVGCRFSFLRGGRAELFFMTNIINKVAYIFFYQAY